MASSCNRDKKKRRIARSTMANSAEYSSGWARLPRDILDSILGKLTLLADYDRFGAVCETWHGASLDVCNRRSRIETQLSSSNHRNVPLLLLPRPASPPEGDNRSSSIGSELEKWKRSLYDVVQGKEVVHDLKLPTLPNSHGRCCGSSHGWLIIADRSLFLTLVNPFYIGGGGGGGGIIRLPPIDSFCNPIEEEDEIFISELSYCKAVLSADPALAPDDYTVVVIYGCTKSLAFIKSGDKDWTYVRYRPSKWSLCNDVMYRDGTIYAVENSGGLLSCKITDPTPRLRKVASPPRSCPCPIIRGTTFMHYIVESPQSELLMVCRTVVESTLNDGSFEPIFRTSEFKVFKLLLLGRRLTAWVQMKNLGDTALFLGENQSTCLLASRDDLPGCQPNSIYFTDDYLADYASSADPTPRIPADMGVFNLEDRSFRRCYDLDDLSHLVRIRPPVWFVPSFPGNWA